MSGKTDLLIIKPGSPKKIYGDLSNSLAAVEPPVWGGMLATFIRDKGYSVKMIDMEIENLDINEIVDKIVKTNPLLINITVMGPNPSASSTPLMPITRELINLLKEKKPEIKTILTGIHPSALPERTLIEEKTDFIARGESFYTILELLACLKNKNQNQYDEIKGLCYLKNNKAVINGWGELINDSNKLPAVAWDLISVEKYKAHNWHCFGHLQERSPYAVIYTSLGCPYNCSYCNIHALYNGKPGIRFRNPEKVIAEIDLLVKKYKVKNIKFLDELFVINEEQVNGICDLLIKRNYNLNIWAYARINTVKKPMLLKMKQAGINWLCYGIESANLIVRKGVDKIGFNKESIEQAVKETRQAGIYILGNFIFGLPDDDFQTMTETLELAKELNFEYVNFYATMAYPGSRLYQEAFDKKWQLPETWLGFAQLNEETLPLATKYVSGKDVLQFRDKAFFEYFSRPEYLEMIKEKFGQEEVLHINKMLSHKINRKFV